MCQSQHYGIKCPVMSLLVLIVDLLRRRTSSIFGTKEQVLCIVRAALAKKRQCEVEDVNVTTGWWGSFVKVLSEQH